MEHCPRAHVINYTNPMTLCVAALYDAAPGIKAHSCCHEVFAIQERVARQLAEERGLALVPARAQIELDIAGVNHFNLASSVRYRGEELLPWLRAGAEALRASNGGTFPDHSAQARSRRDSESWFECDGLVSLGFLVRFGVLGAAGDRHLAEFVPWFLGEEALINSYGVPLTPYAWRIATRDAPRPSVASLASKTLERSGEEGVAQIEALLGFADLRTNVNLPNQGQWADAPAGHIVETYALFQEGRVTPLAAGRLPPAAAALESRVIEVQGLVQEASRRRDPELALQALLLDPLVSLPLGKAEAMLAEMLEHARPWMPDWPAQGPLSALV